MRYSLASSLLAAASTVLALPSGPVGQIPDGQIQANPVSQIADGQVQAHPVSQIADGQVQAKPVSQIGDGQVQAKPVSQIADGQIQAKPAKQMGAQATGYGYSSGGSSKHMSSSGPQMPFKFPLANGFPEMVSPATLMAIEKQAHGTLPNGALPKKLSDASAATLQLIAFNEIFEVAFFTSLLHNITDGSYDVGTGAVKQFVINAITAIQGQEQLHAIGANAILASAGRTQIKPCEYVFPSMDFDTAIATSALFTDVVLGTLGSAQNTFATTGDAELVTLVSSIVGQEAEQEGWFRTVGMKIPSALPFLTGGSGAFAFSVLNQLFVVPGTCGNIEEIPLPILKPLTVVTSPVEAKDQELTFSYPIDKSITSPEGLRLVYINQQNTPVVEMLSNIKVEGETVTFTAPFPYMNGTMNGLTICAVTNGKTSFANPDEVAAAAVWGPGLIEIN